MDDSKVQRLGSDYDTGWEETKRRCQTYKFQPVILCYEAVATGGSGGGGGLHDADEGGHAFLASKRAAMVRPTLARG